MDFDKEMDAEKLKEILEVVSAEVPKLVESITKVMYSPDNADNMAKAVAAFYKQMKDAGMDDKQAFELTEKFMSSFSLGGLISKAFEGGHHDAVDADIEKCIKEKIKKKMEDDD